MSHTNNSPHSSTGAGPSSSPFGGTDLTAYSPEAVRNTSRGAGTTIAESSRAGSGQGRTQVTIYQGLHPMPHRLGTFLNELANTDKDFVSRFLFVGEIPDGVKAGSDFEMEMFAVQHQMKLYQVFNWCVPTYARGVYLRFDNIRDSCESHQLLNRRTFKMFFVDTYDFAIAKSQDTSSINEFEGQVKLPIVVSLAKHRHHKQPAIVLATKDLIWLTEAVECTMSIYGTVRASAHTATDEENLIFTFRIEFHSVEAANRAVASLARDPIWGLSDDETWHWTTLEPSGWNGTRAANSPHRHNPQIDDLGRLMTHRHLQQVDFRGLTRHPADAHNRVRREKIMDGTDVRTTIMLRNIPNKLDWMTLKGLLDEVCFGTFDFLYLRIDFKTSCNVGYAFINFSDITGMIAMLDRVEHCGWKGYRSNKAAEISYATIQGLPALVQKFRNSSVMQETPYCRPRVFMVYEEARADNQVRSAGTEMSFARPDNLSKLQRSMDSARSIGLFPPTGISEAARRRNEVSAYDHGNPRELATRQIVGNLANPDVKKNALPNIEDHWKQECELWYLMTSGAGHYGRIPYEYIPVSAVQQFLREHRPSTFTFVNLPDPGVIGGPAPSAVLGSQPAAGTPGNARAGPSSAQRPRFPGRRV
ncbi:hypothetical protein BU26DRAFT_420545 [Trematosphaeria pertusa]|uniref:Mei2-like C-terminal RNA recognition motif domain-containing protein n=1 Tax=Trematosphaeria pertusa TaxID=390896 RepID=A0A6A6ITU8_9PLEO|nr:uncharacterized protein BU26DRAFT_420545 [Trematosphaeria pertusa]KAF2253965.1 hypothetical protein BU26DRAFT_420545 [Trematosphaeria pertusa]